jgi:hypothetical protein
VLIIVIELLCNCYLLGLTLNGLGCYVLSVRPSGLKIRGRI